MKNVIVNLIVIAVKSVNYFRQYGHFNNISSNPRAWDMQTAHTTQEQQQIQ